MLRNSLRTLSRAEHLSDQLEDPEPRWPAIIAILAIGGTWSLSNLAALLRFNLLSYRDLWAWLDAPFKVSIVTPQQEQMSLLS